MSPSGVLVHVVMVNYRSAKHVDLCLRSLEKEPIASITIVDNNSGKSYLESLYSVTSRYANVRVVESAVNGGFGAGVNAAVAASGALEEDAIWILNPDTVVHTGCVQALVQRLELDTDIVSPLILSGDVVNSTIWFAGGYVDLRAMKTPHLYFGRRISEVPELPDFIATDFVTGAAPCMFRSTWNRLGGLRSDFFMYWEDADLSLRAQAAGLRMEVVSNARVWHAVGGTSGSSGLSPLYYRFMQKNRAKVAREQGVLRNIFFGKGLLETARLTIRPLFENSSKFKAFRATLYGLKEGIYGE